MEKAQIEKLKSLLKTPQNIVVVGHKNPDGDAIGSCLALSGFLKAQGHHPTVIMPNDFPHFLKWLPDCNKIITYDKEAKLAQQCIDKASIIFTLDFNMLYRVDTLEKPLENSTAHFVMIDHHQAPGDYATVTYSDTSMSSTCEMVYHFANYMGMLDHLNAAIATQIYTGIMTDTGSFRFPSTTATTHKVVAHLIEAGANGAEIHQNVYDSKSPEQLQLLGVALKNLVVLPEFKTAYISLTQKELDDHKFKKGDTEGVVNYALSITGIVFAAIFIENKKEDIVKISLRSKGNFSVNEFSRKHFNGGGHTNAAGGKSDQKLQETITNFISILPHYKNDILNA